MQHNTPSTRSYLFLRVNYSLVKIDPDEITYIECVDNYMKLHLKTDGPLLVRITLKALIQMLPQDVFMRVHRSYVVSLNHIDCVRNRTLYIGQVSLPMGVSFVEPFLRKIKNSTTLAHAYN